MGYELACSTAWNNLQKIPSPPQTLKFLNQIYQLNLQDQTIINTANNKPTKEFITILLLHYLLGENNVTSIQKDKWISFKSLPGGETYYPAFYARAINPLLKKYGTNPTAMLEKATQLNATSGDHGASSIILHPFEKIKVQAILWPGDDEFPPEGNMLFTSSIPHILPTEDTAVLGGLITGYL